MGYFQNNTFKDSEDRVTQDIVKILLKYLR